MNGPDVRKELPYLSGGWGTIVADPPWRMKDRGSRMAPKYPTMTTDEIAHIPIESITAEAAYLFLWVPSAMLVDGIRVALAWGFQPKGTFVWCKVASTGRPHIGGGHHVRNAHEFALVATRGKITALDRSVPSWIAAPRAEHSAKPEECQDAFEKIAPAPRLELFARRMRRAWLCWGNELDAREAWRVFREPAQPTKGPTTEMATAKRGLKKHGKRAGARAGVRGTKRAAANKIGAKKVGVRKKRGTKKRAGVGAKGARATKRGGNKRRKLID